MSIRPTRRQLLTGMLAAIAVLDRFADDKRLSPDVSGYDGAVTALQSVASDPDPTIAQPAQGVLDKLGFIDSQQLPFPPLSLADWLPVRPEEGAFAVSTPRHTDR